MTKIKFGIVVLTVIIVSNSVSLAHDIVLNESTKWDQCSMQISQNLTQSAWGKFNREVGQILAFRPMSSPKPLGKWNFEIVLTQGWAPIDDTDPAWNDTFVHPHSTHWLYGEVSEEAGVNPSGHAGSSHALALPMPLVRLGITDRIDIGATFIKAPGANYGFMGTQVQYSVLNDTENNLAGAVRGSIMTLIGVADISSTAYAIDALASKDIKMFTAYGGLQAHLVTSKESTSVVDLDNETKLGVQAYAGVNVTLFSHLRVGAEIGIASMVIPAIVIGYTR